MLLILVALAFAFLWKFTSQKNYSPAILVIGDSQISFGAGQVYLEIFGNLKDELPKYTQNEKIIEKFNDAQTAAIGVRSTSIQNWTTRDEGEIKDVICEIDKRWGVNAGVYGVQGEKSRKYVNIGQGVAYQFCQPNQSALEAMFENGYYKPELLIMAFLGNSAERWAGSQVSALQDVQTMINQIPPELPCIFLTTSPSYLEEINQIRSKAQDNVKQAFELTGNRCSFVSGFTEQTIAIAEGNKNFFKTNDEGVVTDVHHPNIDAARQFFEIKKSDLFKAVIEQFDK